MENLSIYDYIQENVNPAGKMCPDCKMKTYMKMVHNRTCELDVRNAYYKADMFDSSQVPNSIGETPIEKVEFTIYPIVERLLNSLSSNEIEVYLKNKELDIRATIYQIVETIEKRIEGIDKKKLAEFCVENLLKTKDMYCMYIYLLLASYADLKDNERLQNIVLKIGLLEEYTLFINDYVLDKFEYPEYARFYLVKRVFFQNKFISDLLKKISFDSDEIKYWVLENYASESPKEGLKYIIWNLDLLKIMEKEEFDSDTYEKVGATLRNALGISYLFSDMDLFEKMLLKFISKYKEYSVTLNGFFITSEIYIKICNCEKFSKDVKDNLIKEFKNTLITPDTISLIKEQLKDPNLTQSQKYNIYEIISSLNIAELFFQLFLIFKNDPIENSRMLYIFKYKRDMHEEAIKILEQSIDWNSLIGEYSAIRKWTYHPDPVKALVYNADVFPEHAMRIYAKTLRCKRLEYRLITANELWYVTNREKKLYVQLPKELRESMEYNYEHEPNRFCKHTIAFIMGKELEDYDEKENGIASRLTLIKQSDDEFLEEERKEEIEDELRNRINLNGYILNKLSLDMAATGVDTNMSGRVIYFKRMNNDITAWCQGEAFGKEYIVKLKGDSIGDLIETSCTCGENNPKDKDFYCKHVAATLIHLSKENDKKNNNN